MKLYDTIGDNLFTTGGIFKALYASDSLDWLSEDNAEAMDIEYYLQHSGEKRISTLYAKLLEFELAETITSSMSKLVDIIVNKFKDNWNKLYESINADYNPIENYSMTEEETPELDDTTTTNVKSKIKTHTEATNYGFNSATGKLAGASDEEVSTNPLDNETKVVLNKRGKRTLTRSGNIGVTTSQQMIESEIELRKKNFVDLVYNDVDSILCNNLY